MAYSLWKCDPNLSYCLLMYWPVPGSGNTSLIMRSGPVSEQWPWLANLFGKYVDTVSYVSPTVRASSAKMLHDIWETTDPLKPFSITQTTKVDFPLNGERHKTFKQDKREGKIVVGPVAVGSCTRVVSGKIDTSVAVKTQSAGDGYYGLGASLNPMGVTPDSVPVIPGYQCGYCVYMVVYSIHTIANPVYVMSPTITMPGEVPGVSIEPGVVTSAVAACNQGTYDLLTEIAEMPQTVAFLSDTVCRIAAITRDHQREVAQLERFVDNLTPSVFAKKLAGLELGFRYAVMPLMYSCQDIRKVLKDIDRRYAEYRERRSIVVPYAWESVYPISDMLVGDNPACVHRCFIKASYTPDTIAKSLIKAIGFNPAATLWELQPLSFVVDWVFNIGDYIVALTSSDDAEMTASTYSVRFESASWQFSHNPLDPSLPKTEIVLDSYRRVVINPSDHIGLAINVNMNWKRYLDGTALTLQKVLRSIRK